MACESKNQALHTLHKLTGDHIINVDVTSRVAWKTRDGCERCALWWPEQCPLALSHAPRWFFVGEKKCRIGRGRIKGTEGSSVQQDVSFRIC
jgi:hypothetical protein